ncbi:pyridoxamine 5'-phosphate oxidase family protein [Halobacteria archaeon AArc-m2/3/4]|uniref:Pyridoxamine 5'-phosphate oxidase family protein n=1 Tax=Natronoglomus mannanivorans TaxID=2979990 RepID=A0AAP2YYA5_9EURY|nr:pyridoxamine 5'-phosphate oxidase family protein [Halobacteria archaeon AArc-xg1-1]MCU4974552.1 pyridoxamine 5'-phosphate oxidase family protein [Halobacteria archaeon AArc-m2/3/4]
MDVRGALSETEIETLLEETVVPIRLACQTPAGTLWMLSLWFQYRDGVVQCATAADADIVSFLGGERESRSDDSDLDSGPDPDPNHVAFEVSTNEPPYRGVRGNGTVTIDADPEKEVLRALLERYLGTTESEFGRWLLRDERPEVTLTIDPAVVSGWDFTDRMASATDT